MSRLTHAAAAISATVRHILSHPVGRRRPVASLGAWLGWQLRSRVFKSPAVVPFVGTTRLVVEPGMTGATGNIYTGLHEFEDMAFTLHFSRPGDLFAEVGANVGTYTILAAGVGGARAVAVEPIAATSVHLRRNLVINGLEARVEVIEQCVGQAPGTVLMTRDRDTMNRVLVVSSSPATDAVVEVPVTTLDALFEAEPPTLMKVDVEGFEVAVLAGAAATLADPRLAAIIIEVSGGPVHAAAVLGTLRDAGFASFAYDPFTRHLEPLAGLNPRGANTLFLRDVAAARARVIGATPFIIKGLRV
jgi:FkbM family methyltransferase